MKQNHNYLECFAEEDRTGSNSKIFKKGLDDQFKSNCRYRYIRVSSSGILGRFGKITNKLTIYNSIQCDL